MANYRRYFRISKTNQLEIDFFSEGLKEYFSKFGVVSEAMVMRDPSTKHSRWAASNHDARVAIYLRRFQGLWVRDIR